MGTIMTMTQFVHDVYDIREQVANKFKDIFTRIAECDSLPCDAVDIDESGNLTKIVYLSDGRKIGIYELIAMLPDELEYRQDPPLTEAYEAYMENVVIEDLDIVDITRMCREYAQKKRESV